MCFGVSEDFQESPSESPRVPRGAVIWARLLERRGFQPTAGAGEVETLVYVEDIALQALAITHLCSTLTHQMTVKLLKTH